MAAQLAEEMKIEAELIPGSKGIFDVAADGQVVFSKHQAGRFPENDEVIQALQAR